MKGGHRAALAQSGEADFGPINEESRPVSRVLSRAIIPLRSTSPWTSSGLPGSARGSALHTLLPEPAASLFGLAPGGVCRASLVTKAAVRSYRTVSPLPSLAAACAALQHKRSPRELRRFALCCTFRGLAPPRRYLAPDPPEPGLSSPPTEVGAAIARPALLLIMAQRAASCRIARPILGLAPSGPALRAVQNRSCDFVTASPRRRHLYSRGPGDQRFSECRTASA